ncbi:hypothetical protein RRG08_044256 [Elysia crispata]|uniref:Uncharacterized protein n=1 Tax=Elysia crispata TaxID=231223 RepID=A0AAE0XWY1_9GAST|nr:hypothetical protein RRG08_044256 [Elysia crispata]
MALELPTSYPFPAGSYLAQRLARSTRYPERLGFVSHFTCFHSERAAPIIMTRGTLTFWTQWGPQFRVAGEVSCPLPLLGTTDPWGRPAVEFMR